MQLMTDSDEEICRFIIPLLGIQIYLIFYVQLLLIKPSIYFGRFGLSPTESTISLIFCMQFIITKRETTFTCLDSIYLLM